MKNKRKLKVFICMLLLAVGGMVLTPHVSNACDAEAKVNDLVKPKKGHWTNKCDCKWPGKVCTRRT